MNDDTDARTGRITCGECDGAGVVATDPPGECPTCRGAGSVAVILPAPAVMEVRLEVDTTGHLTLTTTVMEGSMGTILALANQFHAAFGAYPEAEIGAGR